MKNIKTTALGTAAIIGFSFNPAAADGFTAHNSIPAKPYSHYVENLPPEEKLEIREYMDYEQREPCQFYQPIPEGLVREGCDLKRIEPKKQPIVQAQKPEPQPAPAPTHVLSDYAVHFAFDSSNIESDAQVTLNKVADEIKTYNPSEVVVAGHTDTAGPSDYNIKLSERRAQAVSDALTDRGVQNRVLDKEAYGESRPAVDTADGVPKRENRRVIIEFWK